jgi:hypothetical protein
VRREDRHAQETVLQEVLRRSTGLRCNISGHASVQGRLHRLCTAISFPNLPNKNTYLFILAGNHAGCAPVSV